MSPAPRQENPRLAGQLLPSQSEGSLCPFHSRIPTARPCHTSGENPKSANFLLMYYLCKTPVPIWPDGWDRDQGSGGCWRGGWHPRRLAGAELERRLTRPATEISTFSKNCLVNDAISPRLPNLQIRPFS